MVSDRWDPALYTPWIEYDICRENHPAGCTCSPIPTGISPTGETERSAPGPQVSPPGATMPPAAAPISLPHAIRAADDAPTIAAALVGAGLQPELAASLAPAIKATGVGWWITSGRRTPGEQEMLMRLGETTTPPSASNHVPCPGSLWATAVDLDPAVDDAMQHAELSKLAAYLGTNTHRWRWGGTFTDPSPHHFDVEKPCR